MTFFFFIATSLSFRYSSFRIYSDVGRPFDWLEVFFFVFFFLRETRLAISATANPTSRGRVPVNVPCHRIERTSMND